MFDDSYSQESLLAVELTADIDGDLLQGQQILEIPIANQILPNISTFVDFARENYDIIIRFRPE